MALQNGLYSKQIYWPKELRGQLAELLMLANSPCPTKHYVDKWHEKFSSKFPIGVYRAALHGDCIEAECCDGIIVKVVTRMRNRYNWKQDICFAIAVDGFETRVKTAWINDVDDRHITIDVSKYVKEN